MVRGGFSKALQWRQISRNVAKLHQIIRSKHEPIKVFRLPTSMTTLSKPRVVYSKSRDKWTVRQRVDGKIKQLGSFDTEAEALSLVIVLDNDYAKRHTYTLEEPRRGDELGVAEVQDETLKGVVQNLNTLPKTSLKLRVGKEAHGEVLGLTLKPAQRDQAVYLISLLPIDGSTRRLDSQVLNTLLRSLKKVTKECIPRIITQGKGYSTASNTSKEYRHTHPQTGEVEVEITNKVLIRKLLSWEKDKRMRDIRFLNRVQGFSSEGVAWIIESMSKLSFSWAGEELASRLDMDVSPDSLNRVKVSDNGRIWHGWTQLPQVVRLNLLLGSSSVADVDMSKSILAILSHQFAKGEERIRLQGLIGDGSVYSRMAYAMEMDAANITKWNADPKNRDNQITTTKQLVNKMLMGHQGNGWFAMQQLKREFPNMMRSISAYKWKCDASGEKGTSKFAIKLHGIEAAIIADVAKKCMDGYIPCVSVFDGMLVPADDAQVVKDFFIEVLTKRLGFAPEPSVETAGGEDMRLEVG